MRTRTITRKTKLISILACAAGGAIALAACEGGAPRAVPDGVVSSPLGNNPGAQAVHAAGPPIFPGDPDSEDGDPVGPWDPPHVPYPGDGPPLSCGPLYAMKWQWTPWYDRDDPLGKGDWEGRSLQIPTVCEHPIAILCETVDGVDSDMTGEVVTCNPEEGFICRNEDQPDGECLDYKVRFLCPAVSSWCAPSPRDMTAWYPLDEASGPSAADVLGGNAGAHVHGPAPTPGMVGGALSFNGQSTYVEVADEPSLNFGTGDFSIDAWIRTTSYGVQIIVDKRYEFNYVQGYALYTYQGLVGFQLAGGGGGAYPGSYTSYGSNAFVADGQWHLVAVTVDRDDPAGGGLWVDGARVATFNPMSQTSSLDNPMSLRIGSRSSGVGSVWNGQIDEVELFRRALSPAEIQSLAQAGARGKCKDDCPCGFCDGASFCTCGPDGVCYPPEDPLSLAYCSQPCGG